MRAYTYAHYIVMLISRQPLNSRGVYIIMPNPRYTKHIFYGKDFETRMGVFCRTIRKDPQFQKERQFEDQGLFSLAIRTLIRQYMRTTGQAILEAEEKNKNVKSEI